MAGIHVNKTPAMWTSNDGVMNMILPDRADDDMKTFGWRKNEDDTTDYATTSGSQFDDANASLTEYDDTNWIKNNNIVLWLNRTSGSTINFDRNNFFPLLYMVTIYNTEDEKYERFFRPLYFSMYPQIEYSKTSDKLTISYWANIQPYDDTTVLDKFSYLSFKSSTYTDYEVGNVISADDATVTPGAFKRALFMTTGQKISGWFNSDIVIEGSHSNEAQAYSYQEIYLFDTPRIVFVPTDATDEVVIDVGGTGSLGTHRHFYEGDGGVAGSTLYPSTAEEVTDSGLLHIIPSELIQSGTN